MKKVEYIVVRDSFWLGVIGDVVMYGILLVMYWFNYAHLGNNGVLNVLFTLLVVLFITNLFSAKLKHTFYSYDEALKYLTSVSDLELNSSDTKAKGNSKPPKEHL